MPAMKRFRAFTFAFPVGVVCFAAGLGPLNESDVIKAVRGGQIKELKEILDSDPKLLFVTEPTKWRDTLLHIAARAGQTNVVGLLLARGLEVDVTNSLWQTPLYFAASNGKLDAVELLLASGANVNGASPDGETPLNDASFREHLPVIEALLQHGAAVDAGNHNGASPLEIAAMFGRTNAMKLLLRFHADVNHQNNFGMTPLHQAAYEHQVTAVAMLLDAGADVNRRSKKGYTPLEWCADSLVGINPDTFALLRSHGGVAAKGRNYGAAAVVGDLDQLKPIVLKVPSVLTNSNPLSRQTLLHLAALGWHPPTAVFLLEQGAPIDAQDDQGFTALHDAVRARNPEMVKVLLARGANVAIKDDAGQTPLDLARSSGQDGLVRLLEKQRLRKR